jgi:acetyl-CoA/propionyl-CoA carboxylase biotin carboxyl carrier protein
VAFDPLIAKLIVHASDRASAIARARAALARFAILGVRTNVAYLRAVLGHPDFVTGRIDTGWLDRVTPALVGTGVAAPPAAIAAAAAARASVAAVPVSGPGQRGGTGTPSSDPWDRLSGWRLGA